MLNNHGILLEATHICWRGLYGAFFVQDSNAFTLGSTPYLQRQSKITTYNFAFCPFSQFSTALIPSSEILSFFSSTFSLHAKFSS